LFIAKGYFAIDDFFKNSSMGIYGVLDGHGGEDVVDYCRESMPKVFRNLISSLSENFTGLILIWFNFWKKYSKKSTKT
jgi:serine/threonine protein phosphatase PrpC